MHVKEKETVAGTPNSL